MQANFERKDYRLPAAGVRSLLAVLERRLGGGTSNRAADTLHFVTMVYFETQSGKHARGQSSRAGEGVAAKVSEDYELHPSLVELATTTDQFVSHQPWVWVELTWQSGLSAAERRFRLPKRELPSVLQRGGEPLVASALVNHRREAFESLGGALRVTVDFDLACYAVPPHLWTSELPLTRGDLGVPSSVEASAVVAVSCRGALPAWLTDALADAGARLAT